MQQRQQDSLSYTTKILSLPVDNIRIGKYQRRLDKARVADIVEHFNPDKMRPIEVSFRDGVYWCWDGQHRLVVHKVMGKTMILCQVHYNLTQQEEALLFAGQLDNVGRITAAHKWNALKEGGKKEVLDIIKDCNQWGFSVHPTKAGGKTFRSVKALQTISKEMGHENLSRILWLISSAWRYEEKSTNNDILLGVALVLKRGLKPVETAKDFKENEAFVARLQNVLASTSAQRLLQASTKYGMIAGGAGRVAYTVVDMYNKRKRAGSRLKQFEF